MKLDTHIVNKLFDDKFPVEVIMEMGASQGVDFSGPEDVDPYRDLYELLHVKDNKNYYITKSVTEHLELFDTKKCMLAEGWQIFKGLPSFKKTYILPDPEPSYAKYGGSGCLRVIKNDDYIQFFHLSSKFLAPEKRIPGRDSEMYWVVLYIDLKRGQMCSHFESEDGKSLAPFLYSLMCFVELCDNQVVEVEPKAKWGTKKQGKIINVLPFPVTVVTNTWNVMTVRTTGFPVKGHVAVRWTGRGRTCPKMVYIAPFEKEGYTRKSGKELDQQK